jgi:hypothetical protein
LGHFAPSGGIRGRTPPGVQEAPVNVNASATLLLCTVLAACGDARPAPDPVRDAARDSADFVEHAGLAAGALAGTLSARLTAAMSEGGPAGAIEFCSSAATQLTDSVGAAHDVTIRRVTTRTRNPENAADAVDRLVLASFDSIRAGGGTLPPWHVRRSDDGELRYYRPLPVQPLCLRCHGAADQLAPEVVQVLADRYPADQATGYAEGDLRGLIRVSSPAGAGW